MLDHISIGVRDLERSIAFYDAAMKHGAESQGEPGLYPQYGENYFAAFVGDIDGYNIEAVCHAVEGS